MAHDRRQIAAFLVLIIVTAAVQAEKPKHYDKKGTWLETLMASREAHMASDDPAPLPKFNRSDFTLMFWINVEKPGVILTKAAENTRRPGVVLIHVRDEQWRDKTGKLEYVIHGGNGIDAHIDLVKGKWHHVAVTRSGKDRTFYFDGEAVRSDARGLDSPREPVGTQLILGFARHDREPGFSGQLDDMLIYNRALSAEEVGDQIERILPASKKGLVVHYEFDGDLNDATGNGHDLAPVDGCSFAKAAGHGQVARFGPRTQVASAADTTHLYQEAMTKQLRVDFPDTISQAEMDRELEDALWAHDWIPGDYKSLADRFARASHRDPAIAELARNAAEKVTDRDGFLAVRELYHKSRRSHTVLSELFMTRNPTMAVTMLENLGQSDAAKAMASLKDQAEKWLENESSRVDSKAWRDHYDAITRKAGAEICKKYGFSKILFVKRFKYTSNHYYTDFINSQFMPAGNICMFDLTTGEVTEIVKGLEGGVFGRFDLSFDATKIVFCWKKAQNEGYRIYECNVDGSGLRQVLQRPANEDELISSYRVRYHHGTDDMDPIYLPDGDICFISTRCQYGILCDAPDDFTTTVLYRMKPDGTGLHKLTNSSVSEATPCVANDGRVLYTRWEYLDKGAVSVKCIWAMRPDGTSSEEVYGNDVSLPPTLTQARPIPGARNQYVVTGTPHYPQNAVGTIVRLDMTQPIRTREPMNYMTPDVDIRGERGFWHDEEAGRGCRLFKDPYPLDAETFLVSMAAHPERTTYRELKDWSINLLDAEGRVIRIYDDAENIGCFMPIPLKTRPVPSMPRGSTDPALAEVNQAVCMVTDVYHGMRDVERGSIKYLRINEQAPRPWAARRRWGGDEYDQQHVVITKDTNLGLKVQVGVVPVEEDGSAHFVVPADRNIFFQALDENYMEVQRERTYVNYRPGEKRSCIGCHETPDSVPTFNPKGTPLAFGRPPSVPGPQPGEKSGSRPLYYATDVQPVLDRHCIACHAGDKAEGGLVLTGEPTRLFNTSYENLIRERRGGNGRRSFDLLPTIGENHPKTGNVHYLPAKSLGSHNSVLVAMLSKGKITLKDPELQTHVERLAKSHAEINMPREDMIRLTTWVDANGQYYGSYWGRRNLQYKDHPNFRPIPTYETAVSTVSPIPEDER
jgi:hypothetical protein